MMFIETPVVAAQSATEAIGGGVTGATLAGVAPALEMPTFMGGEEVSQMFTQAVMAHSAQFLAATGAGVAQRALFATQVGVSAASYEAMNAATAAEILL